ncbi:UNVERIFIED_CONTAM: hypothetical protein HDU68_001004 [Siphonaria sp. JEL0065]|nr:hypothetical protein HDU68_001004 [Siphonaria sp. JEL0065]
MLLHVVLKLFLMSAVAKSVPKLLTIVQLAGVHSDDELEDELEEYLKLLQEKDYTDPLIWWEVERKNFPNLYEIASDYVMVPSSSNGLRLHVLE